jgi:hypothetical protein
VFAHQRKESLFFGSFFKNVSSFFWNEISHSGNEEKALQVIQWVFSKEKRPKVATL